MTEPGMRNAETGGQAPAIRMSGIDKSFGVVRANRGATLEVRRGDIHALVGENGAGKSTLMRILSGMLSCDAGTIEVDGRDVTGWTTARAIAAGVGMVHQHFMLVPTLTVAENVVLGREPVRAGGALLDRARAVRDVREISERTGLVVPPDRRVSELSVGEAQRVEILKALFRGARLLILDEPTAVLSPPEVQDLWAVLRRLRADGSTIVLITHKLDEVMAISDLITVMRAGRTVERLTTAGTTPAAIARAMVGRDVALSPAPLPAQPVARGSIAVAPVNVTDVRELTRALHPPPPAVRAPDAALPGVVAALEVRDLAVDGPRHPRAVDGVSFTISPGEILGIAGVEGNGQTELVDAIAGLRTPSSGSVFLLGGRDVARLDVRTRADRGLAHIPEDRHQRGLILDFPVADNLVLGQQHLFTAGGVLDRHRIDAHARDLIAAFDIRPGDPGLPARALSGGNQQKIVIAREMGGGRAFHVLLASQPTRGVDVGAIEFIHARLLEARAAGKAILLVSADLPEILALSDRVAVMYRGRFAAVFARHDASAEVLGPYMTGAAGSQAA